MALARLFDYTYWYADNTPSFELLNVVTQKYLNSQRKIAISMTIQEATENFPVDLPTLQNFLPIEGFGEEDPQRFLFSDAYALSNDDFPDPLIPETTMSESLGSSKSIFLRLCSRAPLMMMRSIDSERYYILKHGARDIALREDDHKIVLEG